MKKYLLFLLLFCFTRPLFAQYVYTINADSVKITNHCDTAELIIENHTQTVPGFLFNKGRGRTEFRHALLALNDSIYLLGADTLNIRKGLGGLVQANNGVSLSAGRVVLGNDVNDTLAKLLSNRQIPMNGKTLVLKGPVAGNQTTLSGGGLTLEQAIANASSFSGIFNMSGSLDFVYNNPNSTMSTGTTSFLVNYTPHGTEPSANITSTSVGILDAFTPTGSGNFSYTGLLVRPFYDFSNYGTNPNNSLNKNRTVRGILYDGTTNGTVPARHIAFENTRGDLIFNSGGLFGPGPNKGMAGFQGITSPTAYIEIGAGTATFSSAPLKFNAGTDMTTPETGAIEYGNNRLAFTPVSTRKRFVLINDVTPANGQIPIGNGTDFTTNTLTAGAGIAVTSGSGAVTIAAKATVNVSAAATLTLATTATDYVFSGTTATWTLPAVTGNTGIRFFIKNRGTGAITLNSSAGGNDLYTTSAVSSLTINAGEAYFLLNDGTYYSVK